jgi:hypothetical protein
VIFGGIDFMFLGIGVAIAARAIGAARGGMRGRELRHYQPPALPEDPRVPLLQAEVDELRTRVERLSAAESFYAQLNAPKPGAASADAGAAPQGAGGVTSGGRGETPAG